MAKVKQYRQGDLLFVEVSRVPETARKLGHSIVQEGEATGHAHQFVGDVAVLYEDGDVKFLEALHDTPVSHEEHATITLPKGFYKVVRQREYTPPEPNWEAPRIRRVRD